MVPWWSGRQPGSRKKAGPEQIINHILENIRVQVPFCLTYQSKKKYEFSVERTRVQSLLHIKVFFEDAWASYVLQAGRPSPALCCWIIRLLSITLKVFHADSINLFSVQARIQKMFLDQVFHGWTKQV